MRRPVIGLLFLLAATGCSNVNVDVDSDSQPTHEKIFPDEMKGRSADYVRPRVLDLPQVEYPVEAADLDLAGMVMIGVLVGYDGQVAEVKVKQGLHPLVDQAALDAARGGRYAPANESGIATDGWVTVPFRYPPEDLEAK
ncbi:MAG: energy transducer TonB [Candidatus Krumholzibacteria bacterium]|nr:energy transducer TonB [Candidatus Krumholzibacteria bacterium]